MLLESVQKDSFVNNDDYELFRNITIIAITRRFPYTRDPMCTHMCTRVPLCSRAYSRVPLCTASFVPRSRFGEQIVESIEGSVDWFGVASAHEDDDGNLQRLGSLEHEVIALAHALS